MALFDEDINRFYVIQRNKELCRLRKQLKKRAENAFLVGGMSSKDGILLALPR